MPVLDINEIKYFENVNTEYVTDSLTGVISRQYIIDIAQKMIDEKTPFSLMILDLDNFKQINDTYGHLTGDFILKSVSNSILELCEKNMYVGRFGGDEFIILLAGVTEYEDVHIFLEKLYGKGIIFRRYYNDGNRDIYVTATLGCAKFPDDATTFNDLFTKADKALYRGKTKGRNCYIIYVESKHGNIVVEDKAQGSLIKRFNAIKRILDIYNTTNEKLKHLVDFLYTDFHCTSAYFILPDNRHISNFYSTIKMIPNVIEPHLELLLNGDTIFYDTPLTKYKAQDMMFSKYVNDYGIQSILLSKIHLPDNKNGYIILCETAITRVWQEPEIAMVMYASALIESDYNKNK